MVTKAIVVGSGRLSERLAEALPLALTDDVTVALAPDIDRLRSHAGTTAAVVVVVQDIGPLQAAMPDEQRVVAVLRAALECGIRRIVLISSTAVYEPTTHHPGLADERRLLACRGAAPPARSWRRLERVATETMVAATDASLTVLRVPPVPLAGGRDTWSRRLTARVAVTVSGYDPPIQLMAIDDLAAAVVRALTVGAGGVYNLAPAGTLHLRRALAAAGVRYVSFPYSLQIAARALLAPLGLADSASRLQALRYPWTVGDGKARRELGVVSSHTTFDAASKVAGVRAPGAEPEVGDPFGYDPAYLDRWSRGPFRFFHDRWFRVETAGLEEVPRTGRVVLVGLHRGFVPFDAIMILHLLHTRCSRHVRFLVHPGLLKFPFLFDFITKVGGMVACRENAEWVLKRDGMVGILPEGVRGAFSLHREGYKIGRFYRDEFVKIALRNGATILPFVTIGAAEVFPILALLEWRWWRRWAEWPGLPITPTFPLLPLPLPAKFHTRFLPALATDGYPPEAADDPQVVGEISRQVRTAMQETVDAMLRRRRSVFRGSLFA